MVTWADAVWIAETIYMYLPAYIANATPVVLGGGAALDGGRRWLDGKPLLGNHKTARGAVSGLAAGSIVGIIQMRPLIGILLSVGAIGGDIIVSFIKRRIDLEPGAMFPVADQMGFIVFAVILASLVEPLTWERVVAILAATFPIHYLTNVIAWLLKLKSKPW